MNSRQKKPKYDFLFVDESGDPGPKGSSYYACTVLHVDDLNIGYLYSALCNFRFMLDRYDELAYHRISEKQLKKINKLLAKKRRYFNCSCVFLNKKEYKGPYLHNIGKWHGNPKLFRKYIYRQVLDLHFKNHKLFSSKVELVLDRSDLSEDDIRNLGAYLNRYSKIPRNVDYITSVDSKYVELVQLADLVCGFYKVEDDKNISRKPGFSYIFIKDKDITYESALGEKYQ